MANETKHSPFILFIAAVLLLVGGWLMAPFPIFIFLGMAPLFALTDRASVSAVWEKMEWVFLTLTISFFASAHFDTSRLIPCFLLGILFTLPFVGYVWVRQVLGPRVGKITILLFWLSLEYLLLKSFPSRGVFLSDALQLKSSWTGWNIQTGYLGGSLLILLTNLMVYQALLSENALHWIWITLASIFLLFVLLSGYYFSNVALTKSEMMNLYSSDSTSTNVVYLARGEWVVRTATWISTLILLFTFIKSQTTRG